VRGDAPQGAAQALAGALVGPVPEAEFARALEQRLLSTQAAWRGLPCDPRVPACAAAAREVAREYAAREAAAIRQALIALYARRLAGQMSEAEMRTAADELNGPRGAALARGLRALLTFEPRSFQELVTAVGTGAVQGSRGATDAFYDRTQDLPRKSGAMAPPPPRP
ncbi:MAG TPA: hypothetical protein VF552_04885, partial [Allosphingosinicella sp.]|jgi:hypothetical protein